MFVIRIQDEPVDHCNSADPSSRGAYKNPYPQNWAGQLALQVEREQQSCWLDRACDRTTWSDTTVRQQRRALRGVGRRRAPGIVHVLYIDTQGERQA